MATVLDVVCGLEIDPSRAGARMEYQGETYYFCTQDHRDNFIAEPHRYLPRAEEHEHGSSS